MSKRESKILTPSYSNHLTKIRIPSLKKKSVTRKSILDHDLKTICTEAKCPNIHECFANKTATFLLLGDICTRNCGYCAVKYGTPQKPKSSEINEILIAVKELGLKYVVLTSVTRDDLEDQGVGHFINAVDMLKNEFYDIIIELLIPDLQGNHDLIKIIAQSGAEIIGHNIETVSSLFPIVRKDGNYQRSLSVLKALKEANQKIVTKSGIMVGMGEKKNEIMNTIKDLRDCSTDILTIGQYLSPQRKQNIPVARFVDDLEFNEYKEIASKTGFSGFAIGPLVRSSYKAEELFCKTMSLR